MAFYIQQPIKNTQRAKIKETKTTFLFQENLKELILFSFESLYTETEWAQPLKVFASEAGGWEV